VAVDYDVAQPWVRQPCDNDLTWGLFQAYLAIPPPRRMGDLVRQAQGLSQRQLELIAWNDIWEARAWHWDRHLDRIRVATVEKVTAENAEAIARRHARTARKLTELAGLELDGLLATAKRLAETSGILGLVPVKELSRMVDLGIKLERLALGESTEHVTTGPDLSGLSLDDLRTLRDLQERAEGHGR
jgi:hypothetical protein